MTRSKPDLNGTDGMIGNAPAFQAAVRAARLIAATDAAVLVLGESGTGKELVARLIHQQSSRADSPLVTVNCAALPPELVESELFGHRRGAFTGAHEHRTGLIAQANNGTLFLDEIAELPLAAQAKLLRFLDYGEIQPLGASGTEQVNVRVVAATHQDLYRLTEQGRFRADLFYRLQVIPVELPPLRDREDDSLLLARAFIDRLALQHGVQPPEVTADAWQCLRAYHWPGNIRELRNLMERCVVLLNGREINADILQQWLKPAPSGRSGTWELPSEGVCLESLEAELIRQALCKTEGNKTRAARLLGLTRDTLLYRLKKHTLA